MRPRFVGLAAGPRFPLSRLCPPWGTTWAPARPVVCGSRCWSPVPEAPTQGGPTVSGTLGTGSQEEAWLEGSFCSVSAPTGPRPRSFALCPVKRAQVCPQKNLGEGHSRLRGVRKWARDKECTTGMAVCGCSEPPARDDSSPSCSPGSSLRGRACFPGRDGFVLTSNSARLP